LRDSRGVPKKSLAGVGLGHATPTLGLLPAWTQVTTSEPRFFGFSAVLWAQGTKPELKGCSC